MDTGTIPASGPGARLMWHPAKAAFRVGNVTGDQWDDVNVGTRSIAMGWNTVASGGLSTALGSGTTASGGNSTALGTDTIANGGNSTAMGRATTASGGSSTAMGFGSTAGGPSSTAMGEGTTASGSTSTAMGARTTASGVNSTAMGNLTTASGEASTAIGSVTTASGRYSNAMGFQTTVTGDNSTAIGTSLSAAGGASLVVGVRAATTPTGNGSFVYGDQSTGQSGSVVTANTANQFLVRASGGVTFYTNNTLTAGAKLDPGGSGWSIVSDVRLKEHFRNVADDDVLGAIARMPVRTWSYKAQDASIRHIGPTAQDFHAAFGLGESDVRINTIDADGVALAAVKALEARTRDLQDGDAALRDRVATLAREHDALRTNLARVNASLRRDNDDLRARLARLESLLDKR